MFIKSVLFYLVLIGIATYLSLFERKLIGRIQLRYGPRYCGLYGLLQPIADGLKLFFKQNALSGHSSASIFACALLLFASLLQFAFLPLGWVTLLPSSYGLLYVIVIHALINFAEILIGITSNSKYGIIGGIRGVYQKMGADLPFILTLLILYITNNSFDLSYIANHRTFISWCIIPILFVTSLMNTNHVPFDFIEAESDLVAGAYTEYGGVLFGIIYLSDYLNVLFNAILISVLALPITWIVPGSGVLVSAVILIRSVLPRCLQIQMIKLSWQFLVPTSTIMLFICWVNNLFN